MQTLHCLFCDSTDVELFSLYGQTLLGSQYYCKSCKSIFETIRFDDEPPELEPPEHEPPDNGPLDDRPAEAALPEQQPPVQNDSHENSSDHSAKTRPIEAQSILSQPSSSQPLTNLPQENEKRTMNFETLLYELSDTGIATITLNRPDHLNSVNMQMRLDFTAVMDELFFNSEIKAVIFTGTGRGFSSGGDMGHFEHDWVTPEFRANSRRLTKFFDDLEALEKPVICAINGTCTGAGFELALACDIRIASETATIGFRENFISLIPGVGGCARLVREIGVARAKELIWMGTMYSAQEIYEMGFLNKVVAHEDLMEIANQYATTLLKRAPQSIGLAKKLLNNLHNIDQTSAIAMEGLAQSILLKSDDHAEGVKAFREKRKPKFSGK